LSMLGHSIHPRRSVAFLPFMTAVWSEATGCALSRCMYTALHYTMVVAWQGMLKP
jgi:hypothetical protein